MTTKVFSGAKIARKTHVCDGKEIKRACFSETITASWVSLQEAPSADPATLPMPPLNVFLVGVRDRSRLSFVSSRHTSVGLAMIAPFESRKAIVFKDPFNRNMLPKRPRRGIHYNESEHNVESSHMKLHMHTGSPRYSGL